MANKRFDWTKVDDELCTCGHRKSVHAGAVNHLHCTECGADVAYVGSSGVYDGCLRFSWEAFLDKNGKRLGRK